MWNHLKSALKNVAAMTTSVTGLRSQNQWLVLLWSETPCGSPHPLCRIHLDCRRQQGQQGWASSQRHNSKRTGSGGPGWKQILTCHFGWWLPPSVLSSQVCALCWHLHLLTTAWQNTEEYFQCVAYHGQEWKQSEKKLGHKVSATQWEH